MIQLSYNNYFKWYYDGVLFGRKKSADSVLTLKYDTKVKKFGSFKEELINNAHRFVEVYPNRKFSIMLSGGSESETLLRTYKEANIDCTAYIFRYERDVNLYDVSFAVSACESLNANYKIIDFNLMSFYNSVEPERISEIAQLDRPRALVHCKFLDYITDNSVILFGLGATGYKRLDDDYSKKGTWVNEICDWEQGWDRYGMCSNRDVCYSWFRFSPELVLAHHSTQWANNLRNDFYYGKLGGKSTKLLGYKEAFPEMLYRQKKTGFENSYHELTALIDEYEKFLEKKYNGLPYRGNVTENVDDIFRDLLEE
jgi:hypothetical protein